MISIVERRAQRAFDLVDVATPRPMCDTQGCSARSDMRDGSTFLCGDCYHQVRALERWEIECAWRQLQRRERIGRIKAAINRFFNATAWAWLVFVLGVLAYQGYCWAEAWGEWIQAGGLQ